MKIYRKIMSVITAVENISLVLSSVLILVLTFGNVVGRKLFHHSWGFTEEIVVAVFVLISLIGAGVAARSGALVNLALIPDLVSRKAKKVLLVISTVLCISYSLLMAYEGWKKVISDHKFTPILHIPVSFFWGFVLVGGISLALHFLENCIEFCVSKDDGKEGGE